MRLELKAVCRLVGSLYSVPAWRNLELGQAAPGQAGGAGSPGQVGQACRELANLASGQHAGGAVPRAWSTSLEPKATGRPGAGEWGALAPGAGSPGWGSRQVFSRDAEPLGDCG